MIKDTSNNKKKLSAELGFGNKNYNESVRFLNQDGTVNIKRKVSEKHLGFDAYHWLLSISWAKFITLVFVGYVAVNTIFALMYFIVGADKFGGLESNDPHKFSQLFFFSAQTLTTVGYGHIYPNNSLVSSVAAIESMLGLMGFALVTGILYGRFAKPKADIQYSKDALIAPYGENMTGFMFRIGNRKQNELIETECKIALAINNLVSKKREFHFLELERNQINFLPFTWTIVHPIDDKSPLFDITEPELAARDAEFVILIKSITDTYFQTVYSRMSYKPSEIVWNAKFTPMRQKPHRDGSISINLSEIHSYEKL